MYDWDDKQECCSKTCGDTAQESIQKSILTIERVANGFIVIDPDFGTQVFEIDEDCYDEEAGEVKAMIHLLWFITESFGVTGSRYSKHRISIEDVNGDKYEPEVDEDGGGDIIFDDESINYGVKEKEEE